MSAHEANWRASFQKRLAFDYIGFMQKSIIPIKIGILSRYFQLFPILSFRCESICLAFTHLYLKKNNPRNGDKAPALFFGQRESLMRETEAVMARGTVTGDATLGKAVRARGGAGLPAVPRPCR